MHIKSNFLIVLNGYYYDRKLDDMYINSIYQKKDNDFSILFIDPHLNQEREEKIKKLENDTGIECLYLPYKLDHNARKYDWGVRNIGCLILENGRFFHWHQHRKINNNFFNLLDYYPDNIGFMRSWIMDRTFFDNGNIEYSLVGGTEKFCAECPPNSALFYSNFMQKTDLKNTLKYCFYDSIFRVDDFITMNGTDEAVTSYCYEEDWDMEERWDVAQVNNAVHSVDIVSHGILYFGHSKNSTFPEGHKKVCDLCIDNKKSWIEQINRQRSNDIEGLEYLGIIDNYVEWFKCKNCGQLYVRTGPHGWGDFSERQKQYNKYKASIGIDGRYGRNLAVLREDVLNSKNWQEACDIINNSWSNKKYYQ